jgi:AraC-like DNA-binding protein
VMPKPKLVLYSKELSNCSCYSRIFNHEFEMVTTETEKEFLKKSRNINANVAVLCFCFAKEQNVEELLRLEAITGPLPVLACSKFYNPNFIRLAAQRGIDNFLLCNMDVRRIRQLIFTALRGKGLRRFLESCCPGDITSSPYIGKMINEIVQEFPHRLTIKTLSQRLGITSRRLQMVCQQAFGKSFTQVMRRILVYQGLNMMKNTNLDNYEIAFQLNYSDESSLARIFRKELGYNPTVARKHLVTRSPEELLT